MLLTEILEKNAKEYPKKNALTMRMGYRTLSLTYKEVYDFARKISCLLEDNGVSKGDKVLLLAPSSPYWVCVFWGTLLRGAIIIPLNEQMPLKTVKKIAEETQAKIFFKYLHFPHEIKDGLNVFNVELLKEAVQDIDISCFKKTNIQEDDVVQLLYTSGTTGNPKGVMLTHKNLSSNLEAVDKMTPVSLSDTFLSILPLSHIFEQMVGLLLPFNKAAGIVYVHSRVAIRDLLKEYRITKMAAVPEFLSVVMSRIETKVREQGKGELFNRIVAVSLLIRIKPIQRILFHSVHKNLGGRLQTIASGGAALDVELEKKWCALGIDLLQGYGLTETSPIISANTHQEHRLGSVGKVVSGVKIKLAPDGEIFVKGAGVFRGYFKDEHKTKEAFTEDGWFKTGDIGRFDKDGFLFIKGRKKYMIKGPGAQNVYPEDIEFELNKISDIKGSCVVGTKKQSGIFEIHAVLLGDIEKPSAIIEKANRNLASYQQITGWSVWPHYDFPRSATQKVKREEVIEWLKRKRQDSASTKTSADEDKTTLIRLLANVTGVSAAHIKPNTKIVPDLNLDSLLRVELVARIEEKFSASIDETKINPHTTVSDLEVMVQKKEPPTEQLRFKTWPLSRWVSLQRTAIQLFFIFPFVRLFVKLEVNGRENLKNLPVPAVFMPTHVSHLDSLVLLMALPLKIRKKVAYAAAKDVLYGQYRLFWSALAELLFNTFPFPRKEKESIKTGLEYIGRLLDNEWSVVIYPEGKMSKTGELLPFKRGTGLVAVEMGVPVVPIKIVGSRNIVPYSKFLPRQRGSVTVTFGKPLTFSKKDSYVQTTEKIEKNLHEL